MLAARCCTLMVRSARHAKKCQKIASRSVLSPSDARDPITGEESNIHLICRRGWRGGGVFKIFLKNFKTS